MGKKKKFCLDEEKSTFYQAIHYPQRTIYFSYKSYNIIPQ